MSAAAPAYSASASDVDISVVIVSYNTRDITAQSVASIFAHGKDVRFEVIVVDNASTDGSVEALKQAFPQITVIASPVNGGFGTGNNLGFGASRGRYLLVLNSDTKIRPGTLSGCVTYMDRHPEVGVLGCRARYEDGRSQSTIFRYPRLRSLLAGCLIPNRIVRNTSLFGDQRYASLSREEIQDVETVAGCFMCVPRQVLEMVGGFDERFFMYGEETEWCHRIHRAGWKIRYHPGIEIMHYGAASTGQTSPWKHVEIARGNILFFRLTRGPLEAYASTGIMLLGDVIRAAYFLPATLVRGRSAAAPWAARIRFLARALLEPPKGQGKTDAR